MLKFAKKTTISLVNHSWAWEKAAMMLLLIVLGGLDGRIPFASATTRGMAALPTESIASATVTPSTPPVSALQSVEPQVKTPPTVQEILLDVCQARGYGEDCAKTLLGMLWKESNNIPTAVGDHGLAHGYFQIHVKLHKLTMACAEDLRCSANWTIGYMKQHGYPKYVNYAVQCHNACLVNNGYAASARRHGLRLWDVPMSYRQTEDYAIAAVK